MSNYRYLDTFSDADPFEIPEDVIRRERYIDDLHNEVANLRKEVADMDSRLNTLQQQVREKSATTIMQQVKLGPVNVNHLLRIVNILVGAIYYPSLLSPLLYESETLFMPIFFTMYIQDVILKDTQPVDLSKFGSGVHTEFVLFMIWIYNKLDTFKISDTYKQNLALFKAELDKTQTLFAADTTEYSSETYESALKTLTEAWFK